VPAAVWATFVNCAIMACQAAKGEAPAMAAQPEGPNRLWKAAARSESAAMAET
jgi:hypothetical protein